MSDQYVDLRDNDAQPLIKENGQQVTYRSIGVSSPSENFMEFQQSPPTDVRIWMIDIPIRGGGSEGREFEAETVKRAKAKFLLSATELAKADVTPKPGDRIVVSQQQSYRILAVNPVAPSGIAVIYKVLVGD